MSMSKRLRNISFQSLRIHRHFIQFALKKNIYFSFFLLMLDEPLVGLLSIFFALREFVINNLPVYLG